MVKVDLSQFPKIVNECYYPIFHDKHRFLVLYGGAGSGKSVTAAQKIVYRMLKEKNHKCLVGRKVANTIRDSVRAEIISAIRAMGVDSLFSYSTSQSGEMTIKCPNNNIIIFRGWDDVEKLKSIKDITCAWLEESSEFTEDDLDQLNLRIRGKHLKNYKQIILTFNPISEYHWLKKRFFDSVDEDAKVLHTTYLDNRFIDDEYKKNLEKLKFTNESYYKVYALGQWGSLKGQIYDNWDVVESMPEHFEIEACGLDFGYNHPQAYVHVRIDGKDAYLDEVFYKSGCENGSFIEEIKSTRPELTKKDNYADSARADLIAECERAGFNVMKAKKDVFAGINTVKGFRLHITARSVNIIREIKTYCWKTDKDGNTLDEPVKTGDDAMDAIRYAIFSAVGETNTIKSFKMKGL